MRLDPGALHADFAAAQRGKQSRHSVEDRVAPSLWQYDYLTLHTLSRDVAALIAELPPARPGAVALDLGSNRSPYRALLEARGYAVRTLDVTDEHGPDYVGTVEDTGLPAESVDLVLCTQVLEHCTNPWQGVREIGRIVRPGGHALLTAPHVWFYHPHPTDHWRFTQEGMVRLCAEGGFAPAALLAQGGAVVTVCQVLNFLAYGALGRAGAPVYAALNLLARGTDGLLRTELFSHNFAILGAKPPRAPDPA